MAEANGHYSYYPGCSLRTSAHAYGASSVKVAEALGLHFDEIHDWNCCGATEYVSLDALPAYSLIARNLSLAAEQHTGHLVAPCSACFLNLRKVDKIMKQHPQLNRKINQALGAGGLSYKPGSLKVRHLLDVMVEDVGMDAIAAKVTRPLKGLRVAAYYGCLIVRPENGYNPEYPTELDTLLQTLGATCVDFPLKAHCCGGHMTQISEDTAYEMIRRILQNAADYRADAIVTLCPMCQLNLDAYQTQVNHLFGTDFHVPILYFTQLMGLAFGMSEREMEIGSELVSARDALSKIGTEVEASKPRKRDKNALPMPR